jgi:hypothetical protein
VDVVHVLTTHCQGIPPILRKLVGYCPAGNLFFESPLPFSLFSGENGRCHVKGSVREHQTLGRSTGSIPQAQALFHRLYKLHSTGSTGSLLQGL